MKLFLGKKLVTKAISTVLDISSFEEILKIAKDTAAMEEAVIEVVVNYYNSNKAKVEQQLLAISENDIQKAHDLLMKALSYTPQWDKELNLTIKFEEETNE